MATQAQHLAIVEGFLCRGGNLQERQSSGTLNTQMATVSAAARPTRTLQNMWGVQLRNPSLGDRNKCQMLTQRLCGDAGT